MREKLIELLTDIIGFIGWDNIADLADYLIENGVVIADGVVSKELYEQIKWERDVALKQLERIGVSLGEKTDNIVSVVRCGECAYAKNCLYLKILTAA